ncbi:xanthine dehydrogenase small subunit [Granulosicoccus sp. 3-233]|uniref:xanthine dehydrogenase small subunit n=1 Tax=Granulosicoccus sp. 3-233 TaxID=3417969 RepID=UPI003D34FA91
MTNDKHAIRFLLNGETIVVENPNPTRTVLAYLRQEQGLVGTKEGCAEGDCGACTVVIGELVKGELQTRTVNACILFLPTLDGKALFTVEYLRRMNNELHPVQQAMVDCHGSQCGFCTPGIVMSLWDKYNEYSGTDTRPDRQELADHLSGNLCRCTGYKPILEAGWKMFDLPASPLSRQPIIDALSQCSRDNSLELTHADATFNAPRSLQELTTLCSARPEATILAGGTDVGLWVNKLVRPVTDIIYLGNVAELRTMSVDQGHLHIGAGVSLSDAYGQAVEYYPQLLEMEKRFASVPVRNSGTLGGNVANGSPIGDSMPWLMALGAEVQLLGKGRQRTIALEDLYTGYMENSMQEGEIVGAIILPLPVEGQQFRTYKLSKRYDSDISAVCAAFNLVLQDDIITTARIAFGGMAATCQRATTCEASLRGKPWNEETLQAARQALSGDYSPLSDMRASATYRQRTSLNLLQRYFLETRPEEPLDVHRTSVFARTEVTA